jgi:peptide/nickel transport system ATP-binding protein
VAAGDEPLLEIRGLKTHFLSNDGIVRAVDGVELSFDRGETLGVVGESGCGKTVTALSVLTRLRRLAGGKAAFRRVDCE